MKASRSSGGQTNVGFAKAGKTLVVVHGKTGPSDAEWDRMISECVSPEIERNLVIADGGRRGSKRRCGLDVGLLSA